MRWPFRRRRRDACYGVVVDGEPARVHGAAHPSQETRDAIADVIRAARTVAAAQPERCADQEPARDGYAVRFPCTRDAGHEPPHRTRSGRQWLDTPHGPVPLEGDFTPDQLAGAVKVAGLATAALAGHGGEGRCRSTNEALRSRRPCMREDGHEPPHQDAMGGQW